VSDDSQGNHEAWPELWVTDQPTPAPFQHEDGTAASERNAVGIRFAGCASCNPRTFGVDSAIVVTNYVGNDSFFCGTCTLAVKTLGAVTESLQPGQLNHIEVQVSQNDIEVYATNPFVPGVDPVPPLVHIASIPNPSLNFTRGLVWIEDAHYNGNKFGSQGDHEFTWDNVGFDGPVLPQDRAFDVLDCACDSSSGTALGYRGSPNVTLQTLPIDQASLTKATGALLAFSFWDENAPTNFGWTVNGHSGVFNWPYHDNNSFGTRTIIFPIPLSDLVVGPNTVTLGMTDGTGANYLNVDLIAVGGGGIVNP
jgi:hypothetical protein